MRSGFKNREPIFGCDRILPLFCPDILINDDQLCSMLCVYSKMKTSAFWYHISVSIADKPLDFTLTKELMTIAPAFTIGLCGLSAQDTRACYHSFAPNHKSNKTAEIRGDVSSGELRGTSANKLNMHSVILFASEGSM